MGTEVEVARSLDRYLAGVAAGEGHRDPEPLYRAAVEWLQRAPPIDRQRADGLLEAWLADESIPWHWAVALQAAARMPQFELLEKAVERGRLLGVHDGHEGPGHPFWLSFQLHLVGALLGLNGPLPGFAFRYLQELEAAGQRIAGYQAQLLSLRAGLVSCLRVAGGPDWDCVGSVLQRARRAAVPRVLRSALGLLSAWVYKHPDDSSPAARLLLPAERAEVLSTGSTDTGTL